jgi:uncharacterized membrane protein YraQ (UPF0718 family)
MRTVVVSLLAALLGLAIRYVRVLHGLNLATMIGLVVSEIALMQPVLAYGSQTSLRGLGSCGRNQ